MKLNEYIKILKEENELKEKINIDEILDIEIEHMTYNSKEAREGSLFVCKGVGDNFKIEYLEDAIKNGAVIYVSEKKYDVNLPCILVNNAFVALSILSKEYFKNPDEKLNVIGITGTKGKSTTSYYIKYILDEYMMANDKNKTAIISSIDTYDGVLNFESHITSPESYDMYNNFRNAVDSNIENLVMEVSSQALKIGRVHSLTLDIGLFLNISEDHISAIEHPDFDDYFNSKLKIFAKSKNIGLNLDSDHSDIVLDKAKKSGNKIVTFSVKDESADIYAYNIRKDGFDTMFSVRTPKFDREFKLTMPGLFNIENALAAITVAYILEIPERYIYIGLEKARSSGRMEVYHTKDKKIIALVDYAHNKLSFEKLYESVKSEYPGRRIVTIFGCPGKKAFLRRRDLGLLSGKNSDKVYLVAEDPGYEPVEEISKEIAKYVKEYTNNYELIEDRGEAIKKAIEEATTIDKETIILITGKGNETRQKYGSDYLPCKSDVEYSVMYLKEYDKKKDEVK